jgi:hypothetical protein
MIGTRKEKILGCPVCRATGVRASHRRGILERGPLTWLGIFPFRCGECQTRFYRIALKDPRRWRYTADSIPPSELPRAPRWITNVPVVVTVSQPGRESTVLRGVAVNASLEGARLRLPTTLPEGSVVSVTLEDGLSRPGTVRWTLPHADSEVLHGVRFQAPQGRRERHVQAFRWLRRRKLLRRGLMALIGLAVLIVIAYGVNWWIEQFRTYYPKYYEPKDIERQKFEEQQRLEGVKGSSQP